MGRRTENREGGKKDKKKRERTLGEKRGKCRKRCAYNWADQVYEGKREASRNRRHTRRKR